MVAVDIERQVGYAVVAVDIKTRDGCVVVDVDIKSIVGFSAIYIFSPPLFNVVYRILQ